MPVIGQFIHEGKEETDPEGIPNVEEDVLVLFGLEERDGMDFELAKRAAVECVKQTMKMPAQFVIEAREKLRDLLLRNRRGEVDIPDRQARKSFSVA